MNSNGFVALKPQKQNLAPIITEMYFQILGHIFLKREVSIMFLTVESEKLIVSPFAPPPQTQVVQVYL